MSIYSLAVIDKILCVKILHKLINEINYYQLTW